MKAILIILSCIALSLVFSAIEKVRLERLEVKDLKLGNNGNLKDSLKFYRDYLD